MATSDVIVVGAGVIGCAVAHELARRGAKVRIFDSRTVAGGATQASAGVLAPLIEGDEHTTLRDLGLRSLALYDGFVAHAAEDSGLSVEYRRCGTIEVATTEAAAERLRRRAAGAPGLQWLEPQSAREIEPTLSTSLAGGLLIPQHGYVAAGALTEALAWGAVRYAAQLETGHRVVSVATTAGGVAVMTEDGTRWPAGDVVLCAGSWHGQIDTGTTVRTSVKPVRGQLLRLTWQGMPPSRVVWGADCYIVPWNDGTVLVGATVEDVGFDERTTAAGVRDLLDAACELLPEAWGATFVEARAGLRPATADGLPIIGRSPASPRVIHATGHYRNGVLLAPLTAQLVADLVLDDVVDDALKLVAP